MATQPPPETPPPSQPTQPDMPPPEFPTPGGDTDIPAPGQMSDAGVIDPQI